MSLLRAYNSLLAKHPIKTMTVATGVLMSTGDFVAQRFVEGRPTWDVVRTAKFAVTGACLFGPAWTVWYRYLDVAVPRFVAAKKLQGTMIQNNTKNQDDSTGPLARPFACLLAPLTPSLTPLCSLRSIASFARFATLICSLAGCAALIHSFAHSLTSELCCAHSFVRSLTHF